MPDRSRPQVKTSLGDLESRLRAALGLVGDIGAQFEGVLTPMVLLTDLRDPGFSDFKGRRFAGGMSGGTVALGTTQSFGITSPVPVIIDALMMGMPVSAGNSIEIRIGGPNTGNAPLAMTTQVGWSEGPDVGDVSSPVLQTAGVVAAATGGTGIWFYAATASVHGQLLLLQPIYLQAGGFVNVRFTSTTTTMSNNASVSFAGRVG